MAEKRILFLNEIIEAALFVCGSRCVGAECKWLTEAAVGNSALGFVEGADPCSGHSNQIHRLTGHLQEDSAGGLLSPWKH